MKENYDDRVKEWWPMRNGNLIVKLEDDAGVHDQDVVKSGNQLPCHIGCYIAGHPKRLLSNVIREKNGFYSKNVYYGDTDNAYTHKNIGLRWMRVVTLGKALDLLRTIMVMQAYSTLGFLPPKKVWLGYQ